MDLLFWLAVFAVTLFTLVKASDYFIDNSEKVGLSFGLPSFIIGITLVAFGTSLPELVSSLVAVFKGASEIVVGNVTGSNITNILLVFGTVCYTGSHLPLTFKLKKMDIVMFLGSTLLLGAAIWNLHFAKWEAILCLVGLVVYLFTLFTQKTDEDGAARPKLEWYVVPLIALSGIAIWLSAQYNIEAIIKLSEMLPIGPEVIALTAVAFGTSLPELIVSVSAVRKGNVDMAVGNILGSNVFNILAVMGIPGLIGNLEIKEVILDFSLPVMIIASFAYFALVSRGQLYRGAGLVLLLLYILFLIGSYWLG